MNLTCAQVGGLDTIFPQVVTKQFGKGRNDGANAFRDAQKAGDVAIQYAYDGLGRRIGKDFAAGGSADEETYYNDQWQALEVRRSGKTYTQTVWDEKYVDAPIVRYRDADGSTTTGTLDMEETLYLTYDRQFNVTGLVKEDQTFVERYAYTPYGQRTVLTGTFSPKSGNISGYDQRLGSNGLELDAETGTYQNRNRTRLMSLGTFNRRDPLSYLDGQNLYSLKISNPVNLTDAYGLTVGWSILWRFKLRMSQSPVLNWCTGYHYNFRDDDGEMNQYLFSQQKDFYQKLLERHGVEMVGEDWMTISTNGWVDAIAIRGKQFDTRGSADPTDGKLWLGGCHQIYANGSFEARKNCNGNIEWRNKRFEWKWEDEIDAKSFYERSMPASGLGKVEYFAEAGWDVFGDKILDTNFYVTIYFSDNAPPETPKAFYPLAQKATAQP